MIPNFISSREEKEYFTGGGSIAVRGKKMIEVSKKKGCRINRQPFLMNKFLRRIKPFYFFG